MRGTGASGPGGSPTVEAIPPAECFRLLANQSVGRVAVAEPDAAPLVVPVNFVVDGESVVFRTDEGTKFDLAVLAGRPVSFEVDGLDGGRRCGWSVLLQGRAAEVDEPEGEHLALRSWAPGGKSHWVRIVAQAISGRRIRPVPDWRWTDLS